MELRYDAWAVKDPGKEGGRVLKVLKNPIQQDLSSREIIYSKYLVFLIFHS